MKRTVWKKAACAALAALLIFGSPAAAGAEQAEGGLPYPESTAEEAGEADLPPEEEEEIAVHRAAGTEAVVNVKGTFDYTVSQEVLRLVNQERRALGLPALTMDKGLVDAAMQRAAECSVRFDHMRPDGSSCFTILSRMNGENIAWGQQTAAEVFTAWKNSSGHYANMTDSSYRSIGIGCFRFDGSFGTEYYWVQCFSNDPAVKTDTRTGAKTGTRPVTVESTDCLYLYNGQMTGTESELKAFTGTVALYQDQTFLELAVKSRLQSAGYAGNAGPIDAGSFTWRSDDAAVVKVDGRGKLTPVRPGRATVTAAPKTGAGSLSVRVIVVPSVQYRTHVQSYGWLPWAENADMSGTSGEAKRMEGIEIRIPDKGAFSGDILYRTHVQSYGWQDWKENGEMSGTSGQAKRLEAIQIELTGDLAEEFDVCYNVHAQSYGWLAFAKNGAPAGTSGEAKRLEAITIYLQPKNGRPFGERVSEAASRQTDPRAYISAGGSSVGTRSSLLTYRTHVQSYGWQGWKIDGEMSGTSGQAKRLEGIEIRLTGQPVSGDIEYCTHVQSYGWQGWKKNGQMSGTSGQARRLEAICIRLTGEMAGEYDVYYRVHAQTYGWLDWAKNGDPAGSAGLAKRLEGIEIRLVKKGGRAPGSTERAFVSG